MELCTDKRCILAFKWVHSHLVVAKEHLIATGDDAVLSGEPHAHTKLTAGGVCDGVLARNGQIVTGSIKRQAEFTVDICIAVHDRVGVGAGIHLFIKIEPNQSPNSRKTVQKQSQNSENQ